MSRSARVGLLLVVGWFSVCMATWSTWDAKVGVRRGKRRRREDMEGRCIVKLQLSGFRQRLGALTVKFGRCRMLNSALINDLAVALMNDLVQLPKVFTNFLLPLNLQGPFHRRRLTLTHKMSISTLRKGFGFG